MIWEARLLTAKDLDAKADRIERLLEPVRQTVMASISAKPIVNVAEGQARASAMVDQLGKRGFVVGKITTRSARNRTETADLAAPIEFVTQPELIIRRTCCPERWSVGAFHRGEPDKH